MRPLILTILLLITLTATATAQTTNVTIDTTTHTNTIIHGTDTTAHYTLHITNHDKPQTYQLFSLAEPNFPNEFYPINKSQTINTDIQLQPHTRVLDNTRGPYLISYELKGETETHHGTLSMNIITLNDIITTETTTLEPAADTTTLTITNNHNTTLPDTTITLTSPFFTHETTTTLSPGANTLEIPNTINPQTLAGAYEYATTITYQNATTTTAADIIYLEADTITQTTTTKGILSRKTTTTKTNNGNIPILTPITEKRNFITRLFTSHDPTPTTKREKLTVTYTWNANLEPGQSTTTTITTNYTIPFILAILIILIIAATRHYSTKPVTIQKNATHINTKSGDFALKITLRIKANQPLKHTVLKDKIPPIAKLYDKYGKQPHHIDPASRTISWQLPSLDRGEERIFTYVIYSKLTTVGNLQLPRAHATYDTEKTGRHTTQSNTTRFSTTTTEE